MLDKTNDMMTAVSDMFKQMQEFQKLALQALPEQKELMQKFSEQTFESQEKVQAEIQKFTELASTISTKSLDFSTEFSKQISHLGAAMLEKGSEHAPMANKVLAMATQIGVMSDRIGEMGDRILFMADKIVEFGNKMIYMMQLAIYTQQMMVNFGIMSSHMMKAMSEAMFFFNATEEMKDFMEQFFGNKDQQAEEKPKPSDLAMMYTNMNLMLKNMHEFSMKLLENEAVQNQNQLACREQQLPQRQETLKANEYYKDDDIKNA